MDPATGYDAVGDLLIDGGVIKAMGPSLEAASADEVIDASGLIAAPGLIDMHCHLREPGQEHKETIESGTLSAAFGGFTSIACMPNTAPVIDCVDVARFVISRAREKGHVNVYPIASVTKGLGGTELTDMEALLEAGAAAFSDDGKPVPDAKTMTEALLRAKELGSVVISHCEEPSIAAGSMNAGKTAEKLGYSGIPAAAEEVMAARELLLAAQTGGRAHIAHISTSRSVALLRFAKSQGWPVTCETCPHYFSLTEEAVIEEGANAKMNPPLRTSEDVAAILEGLRDGTIDAIVTDHAPHSKEEKAGPFEKTPNGIVGFETALALGITHLVEPGVLTMMELLTKMTVNPAKILGLSKGRLAPGEDADIVLIDPKRRWTVEPERLRSKSKNTPYGGHVLTGAAVRTMVAGKTAAVWGRNE